MNGMKDILSEGHRLSKGLEIGEDTVYVLCEREMGDEATKV